VSQSRSAVTVTRTTVTRRFPRVTTVASAVVLTVSTILVLFPYLFAVSTSTKTYNEFLHQFLLPTLPPNVNNYVIAWQLVSTYILNTALVTVLSVIPSLLFASMSAYVFARHRFPGRDALFLVILSLIMIPGIVSLLPRFIVVMQLGLLNSYWALVLPYISGSQVFAIFVLRTFIAELPEELFEAARIDGATDLQMYYQIAIPLSKAILGTLAILQTRNIWNDLIWPLMTVNNPNVRTISVGLAFLNNDQQSLFGAVFAGYVLASLPMLLLFAFTMRQFMSGLTSGALKI